MSNAAPSATPSAKKTDLPRLCFISYPRIRAFAAPVLEEFTDRAVIDVVDGVFEDALANARERLRRGAVDAFVSAGSNAAILRANLSAPVATIEATGFDILQALIRARQISRKVGVVTYGATITELEEVKPLLDLDVAQYAYLTPEDAKDKFEQLRRDGYGAVVGSSLVVDLAQAVGLPALLAYSQRSVRKGFEEALELARVARIEAARYAQLESVLSNIQEAVVAVDRAHRIIAVNGAMQLLLGRPRAELSGERLDEIAPELALTSALERGNEDRGVVMRFRDRDWVANRTPIREGSSITGAALTLYDVKSIQDADTSVRIQQRRRQHAARHRFSGLIGSSEPFLRAVNTARRYAATDLTVLIVGESGSGKELFAQAIHNESRRQGKPFVAVNCAAFPETLLESELFGYEDGAFTGSRRGGKRGLIETAHTGTLFLDEIGDMPQSLQTRLLRVLQEREITRLGATAAIPVDVRIIAATHQPLQEMVSERRFRQDLYYRINTLRIALPPLRERPGDVAVLATMLLRRSLEQQGSRHRAEVVIEPLLPLLQAYAWPGNVRELENICERLAVFVIQFDSESAIDLALLPEDCPELFEQAQVRVLGQELPMAQRVAQAMRLSGGNRQEAARRLGISRSTLWRWLRAEGEVAQDGDPGEVIQP
ncbi:propionate catabolism operon regulatory protein PrpR [Caenimonas sp. SL110]|uniref:propionate catabolism operon regulatory protein PrpR n=1 Tax=Caenimonas sp. SL110 TaxID=1450524 RepID=UPI000652A172|nr:propionate catabolism operon regulatory protein PrpR [Caenimonas sp. SL110]